MADPRASGSAHQIRRKPLLPARTNSGLSTESTKQEPQSKRAETLSSKAEDIDTIQAVQRPQHDAQYADDPPPYDEIDFQRAEEANEAALEAMDLDVSVDSAMNSECGDDSDTNELGLVISPSHGNDASSDPGKPSGPSKWKSAMQSTKTFLSDKLLAAPVQSTRHYSVLRHSNGLIPYRGLGTHVAITLFGDAPAYIPSPENTSIYLQQRGWSGDRGMAVKNMLRARSGWMDVTPIASVEASQIKASDERTWQRHIATFLRKAAASSNNKNSFAHRRPVATYVVRIPVSASDGYFRLVVCASKGSGGNRSKKGTILCASPVFRVASLSASNSASFRGASLRTLPLEIGVKALSISAASAATQGAAPLALVIRNRFGAVAPAIVTRSATAVGSMVGRKASRANTMRFDGANDGRDGSKNAREQHESSDEVKVTIGSDEGPEAPYPVQFSGKVVRGAGKSNIDTGLPTANLDGVSDWFRARMDGIYFGWVSISQSKTITSAERRPALIFARPPEGVRQVSPRTALHVFIIEDFAGVEFFGAKLDVLLLGFIRSWEETHPEQFQQETAVDILIARQSLERPNWQPEIILEKHKDALSLSDWSKFTRKLGRMGVDRVPFEKLAIRMPHLEARDELMGRGGLLIDRRAMPFNAPLR